MLHQIELAPEFCLPAQFYSGPKPQPELNLLKAMIEDAVYHLNYAFRVSSFKARHLAHDDSLWLTSQRTSPWSFLWCCTHLGVDPDRISAAFAPLLVLEPPRVVRCGKVQQPRALAYQIAFANVKALDRTGYFLIIKAGSLRTQIAHVSIHPESEVHAPGDVGRLICTRSAARKAGLLPPIHKPKPRRTSL